MHFLKIYCITAIKMINFLKQHSIENSERIIQKYDSLKNKYCNKDWGDTCKEDCEYNNDALINEDRIFAKYKTSVADVFIITEWDRSVTTILFASEY